MEAFLFAVVVQAFLVSGSMSYFLKGNIKTNAISVLIPLFLVTGYICLKKDEFGYWAILLTFGFCCSIMGSTLGLVLTRKLKSKKVA